MGFSTNTCIAFTFKINFAKVELFSVTTNLSSTLSNVVLNNQIFTALYRALARIAANVRAAWRRRGVRYSSCGTLTFIFPLHFPRRYTPACAKPPVICCRFWVRTSRFVFEAHIHFRRLPFSRHFRTVQFCRVYGFVYNVFGLYFSFELLFQGRMYKFSRQ